MKYWRGLNSAIVGVCLFVSLNMSQASTWDGLMLKDHIDATERLDAGRAQGADVQKGALYLGYVAGVSDALQGVVVCPPPNGTNGQLMQVVSKYVRENPAKWAQRAGDIVIAALSTAFPCKSSR